MATPTLGHPGIVDGIVCSGKNIYQQKILESVAAQRQKTEEHSRLKKQKEYEELESIVQKIDYAFATNKVVDGTVTIETRLKYLSTYGDMCETKTSLNAMLSSKGLIIGRIAKIDTDFFSDDCCACFWTSLLCCCIPVFYWIPRCILDDKYGPKYTIRFSFEIPSG